LPRVGSLAFETLSVMEGVVWSGVVVRFLRLNQHNFRLTIRGFVFDISLPCRFVPVVNAEVVRFVLIVRWPVVWCARVAVPRRGKAAEAVVDQLCVVRVSVLAVCRFGPGSPWASWL
jgi:hypothetical protein